MGVIIESPKYCELNENFEYFKLSGYFELSEYFVLHGYFDVLRYFQLYPVLRATRVVQSEAPFGGGGGVAPPIFYLVSLFNFY